MKAVERSAQFWNYVCKVHHFDRFVHEYPDSRPSPRIPASSILTTFVSGILARAGSVYQLGRWGQNGLFDAVFGKRVPQKDTLYRFLAQADLHHLRAYMKEIVRNARHNKAYPSGTLAGWMIATLDGTETFRTRRQRQNMSGWNVRKRSEHGLEYYEKAVAASYVGIQPRLCLGVERTQKGEGEITTAARLVRRLDAEHGPGWCDILVADSLYPTAPFLHEVLRGKRHIVVKLKQEGYQIAKDADALFATREPSVRIKSGHSQLPNEEENRNPYRYDVAIWDEEGFVSWEQVDRPLRCLKIEETRKTYKEGTWVEEERQTYHVITSLPQALAKTELIWTIMHRRWDIENSLFNDWEQNWAFTHCYTHDTTGIEALYLLFGIAFNLLLLFQYRHLRRSTREHATLKEWARIVPLCFIGLHVSGKGAFEPWRRLVGG